jgi:hypothetical protein
MRDRIIAGDTLDYVTTLPDYPASGGYTLKYRLHPQTTGTAIDITCSAVGDDHRAGAAASVTAAWAAGEYSWSCWVEKGAERYSGTEYPWRGECTILPNPATTTTYDGRSPARKALDAINAGLETYGEKAHIVEYEIGNRRMKFGSSGDLLVMRDKLKAEVWREDAAAKLDAGGGNPRRVYVRLNRA